MASYPLSPQVAYVSREMVVIDGSSHLRSSGAENLLAWTPEQWERLRAAR